MTILLPSIPVARMPQRLSYSAVNTYSECGERYRLSRLYGYGEQVTWFASLAGTAFHSWTDAYDMQRFYGTQEELPTFIELFDQILMDEKLKGTDIRPSGKVTEKIGKTGGPNKKNDDWYRHWGPIWTETYATWRDSSEWDVLAYNPTPNQSGVEPCPAIEVLIDSEMGDENFKGFIDRVLINRETREVIVMDVKTGSTPVSTSQLGTYRVQLERQYGIKVSRGAYWSPMDGELGPLFDLSRYTPEYLDHQYVMAWNGIRNGVYMPHVTQLCKGCTVRDYCRAVGGDYAGNIPIETRLDNVDEAVSDLESSETVDTTGGSK